MFAPERRRRRKRRTSPTGRRSLWGLVAASLLAAAVIAVPSVSSAHNQLLSTDPDDGAVLTAMPDAVTLTFNDVVLAGGGANEVEVLDASCRDLTDGDLEIEDNVVTQPISGDADGPVQVLWRVVSRDGHPVAGEFGFTVSADGSATPTADASCTPSDAGSDASGTASSVPWRGIGIGVAIVIVAAGAVVVIVTRRRRRGADDGETESGSDPDHD